MGLWDENAQAFKALSYRDKWRVSMCLRRGEAPDDPRLAAAAVDLAEGYRRQGRTATALTRWAPAFLALGAGGLAIWAAVDGDQRSLIANALLGLGWFEIFLFNRGLRPKNVARALEASRRMLPSDWSLDATAPSADEADSAIAAGWYPEPDNVTVERLWDGEDWTSWVRPRAIREDRVEADPAGWQPHPSRPGKELLWSGNDWTNRERDSVEGR